MVDNPKDYRWSSYSINAIGIKSSLCTPHASYIALSHSRLKRLELYRELFLGQLPSEVINDIRLTTQKGLVLGTDKFKNQLSELLGRSVEHRPKGRPRKNRL